jgi:hypothetical protein
MAVSAWYLRVIGISTTRYSKDFKYPVNAWCQEGPGILNSLNDKLFHDGF